MAEILRNETDSVFTDISSETSRCYRFPGGESVTITSPQWLAVSKSGGHRILGACGICYYIPPKWIQIIWSVREGAPHFVR